jgi:antitoxin MazE
MKLQVAKWGNSLAVRIPAEYVRVLGITEGDQVQANLNLDGSIRSARWDRAAFAQELEQTREAMPVSEPVIETLRRDTRY